ncbi:hypothetical protein [Geodermatophilus sp. SYSU D00815]
MQSSDGEDERVEAGMLATDGGALLALTDDGLLQQAWAPGQWRTARRVADQDPHPGGGRKVLVGVPVG